MIILKPGRAPSETTIRRITIKGLHGYMDKDLILNPDINLLVGINGSGKTSVLNVISWILQPAIPQLCITEFREITLELMQNRTAYKIRCTQTSTEFRLRLQTRSGRKFGPLVVQLQRPPALIRTGADRQEMLEAYAGLQPDKGEQRTWRFLQRLPSPIVVGLERTLGSETLEMHISARKGRSLGHVGSTPPAQSDAPLRRVQQLASEAFGRYRTKLIELNDDLRDKITLAAFDIGTLYRSTRHKKTGALLTETQITSLQERVERYFAQESTLRREARRTKTTRAAAAGKYFARLKRLVRMSQRRSDAPPNDPLRRIIVGQFQKINQLFADFERFEADSRLAFSEIEQYLQTVNRFFRDSAKRLDFEFNTGILSFQLEGRNEVVREGPRNLELLSSGEKQIVILFTYLAFSRGNVFVIDEPELSLHPRWQEEFLGGVSEVMPKGTQLIIATHPPAIVGKHVNYCKTLLPYNG